jgi:hypothetical protein
MKSILFLIAATLMPAFSSACALAEGDTSPMDIKFNRQAVRRLVFDQDQSISLSTLNPANIVKRSIEYPTIALSEAGTDYTIAAGKLRASAKDPSESALWVGGFNPLAAYDVSFEGSNGRSVEAGVEFASPDNRSRLMVLAGFKGNECRSIRYQVIVDGKERTNELVDLEKAVKGPFTLRVHMLGSGLNIILEQDGVSHVVGGTRHFSTMIDLRRKEHIRTFEFRLLTRLGAGESVVVNKAGAYLTPGFGQADICHDL